MAIIFAENMRALLVLDKRGPFPQQVGRTIKSLGPLLENGFAEIVERKFLVGGWHDMIDITDRGRNWLYERLSQPLSKDKIDG